IRDWYFSIFHSMNDEDRTIHSADMVDIWEDIIWWRFSDLDDCRSHSRRYCVYCTLGLMILAPDVMGECKTRAPTGEFGIASEVVLGPLPIDCPYLVIQPSKVSDQLRMGQKDT